MSLFAWAGEEGGIFTNPQTNDLVTFLQQANWDYVEARVAELGLTPPDVIQMEVSEELLAGVAALPGGESLSTGLTVYAENCAACHGGNAAGSIIAPALDTLEVRETPREETLETINAGVAGTLMSSWERQLTMEQISSHILQPTHLSPSTINTLLPTGNPPFFLCFLILTAME